ncbi:MAG: hypothetical protein EBX52_07320 [Proteobacteria bacterium]|nr:hypothetical protein [Pseudomonadota bacterium]
MALKQNFPRGPRNTPWKIQEYVSSLPYNPRDHAYSAERAMREGRAHCFEGALIAAYLLEKSGHEPALLHFRAHRDDDHAVAVFKEGRFYGAVGKSNTTLLGWRPPHYRSVQDLLFSYFPFYFNTKGQMSLIAWAGPVRLSRYETWNWRDSDADISDLSATFYDREKARKIMSPARIERLPRADEKLVRACFLGANSKGLYKA